MSPPTILESLEGACQKFQYGGCSGDSVWCIIYSLYITCLGWT